MEEIRSTIFCAMHSRYHIYKIADVLHQPKVSEPLEKCVLEHKKCFYSPSKQALRSLLLDDKALVARFVASFRPCFQRMEAS